MMGAVWFDDESWFVTSEASHPNRVGWEFRLGHRDQKEEAETKGLNEANPRLTQELGEAGTFGIE